MAGKTLIGRETKQNTNHRLLLLPQTQQLSLGGSAPMSSHTSRRTKSWLSENFYDHNTPNIWLPNSPDYDPLYYVRGTFEQGWLGGWLSFMAYQPL